MKNILKYALAALSVIAVASCDLDLFPTTSIAYDEGGILFQKSTDIDDFENGILASFRSLHRGEYYIASDVMCDAFNASMDFGNNYGGIHCTDAGFTAEDYYVRDYWSANYGAIKNYNIVIASADNIEDASLVPNARIAKGEAFFFRAFSYINLARHFGKDYNASTAGDDLCVPLILKYDQNEKPARKTVKDVYAQVKCDLDSAAFILGNVEGTVRAQRPTIDAVNALYARYYLDIDDYAKAAEYAVSVIKSHAGYAFEPDADALYDNYHADKSTEPIMQMYISKKELPASMGLYSSFAVETNEEGYAFSSPYFIPTKKLIDAYEEDDYRFYAWFDDCSYYPCKISGDYKYGKFYLMTKFWGNEAYNDSGIPNGYNAVIPFRLPEMYLIAAEAYLESGNAGSATEYLNALQVARGATATDATKESVHNEWFKETVGEGLRMTCLKRWGEGYSTRTAQQGAYDEVAVMTNGSNYDKKSMDASDYHFQWPIPTYEIKINENLVQNPGYSAVE